LRKLIHWPCYWPPVELGRPKDWVPQLCLNLIPIFDPIRITWHLWMSWLSGFLGKNFIYHRTLINFRHCELRSANFAYKFHSSHLLTHRYTRTQTRTHRTQIRTQTNAHNTKVASRGNREKLLKLSGQRNFLFSFRCHCL